MNHTEVLKSALWRCYGSPEYPAEWDGTIYGGGKLSQRYWEYHTTIELLDLTPDSVVLDIGGGSPATGAGFFTRVIAPYVKAVHVMDVNIGSGQAPAPNIIFHRTLGSYEALSRLLTENPQITHVACISVFEHIPGDIRRGMVEAVNAAFKGDTFVATLEYHAQACMLEYQLTARTLSELVSPLTNFYPDIIRNSPVWCESAYYESSLGRSILRRLGFKNHRWGKQVAVPLWYPVAMRFKRVPR